MRKRRRIIVATVAAGATLLLLAFGLFFLIGGVWSYFFGTRYAAMLSPLVMVFGVFIIIIGIIIVLKLIPFLKGPSDEGDLFGQKENVDVDFLSCDANL